MAERIYELAREFGLTARRVHDLYCGIGTIV
jgi:tRNA/tmRNA/rRNA uracil-C5-methylase (TrmA/RlmC/RlmD family)